MKPGKAILRTCVLWIAGFVLAMYLSPIVGVLLIIAGLASSYDIVFPKKDKKEEL